VAPDPLPPPYRRPDLPFERAPSPWLRAASWSGAGLEFGLAVILGFYGGRALDRALETEPWLATVGALLGVAAGIGLLVRPFLAEATRSAPRRGEGGRDGPGGSGDPPRPPAARGS